jgi:hypothetical protein
MQCRLDLLEIILIYLRFKLVTCRRRSLDADWTIARANLVRKKFEIAFRACYSFYCSAPELLTDYRRHGARYHRYEGYGSL